MIDCRSKLEVPNNIWGWWSMNATAQLSGVSRPFSLRFICCVCAIYLFLSDPKLLPPLSSFEVHTDASVVPIPLFLRFTKAALDANLRGQCAMNGAFVRDFQQPMTLFIRQLANQFNVSFNLVGEVPLP